MKQDQEARPTTIAVAGAHVLCWGPVIEPEELWLVHGNLAGGRRLAFLVAIRGRPVVYRSGYGRICLPGIEIQRDSGAADFGACGLGPGHDG